MMVSPSWLLLALMAHSCHSSRSSKCWDSNMCANLSNKHRILECIQMCMAVLQNESPQISDVNEADDPLGLEQNSVTSDDPVGLDQNSVTSDDPVGLEQNSVTSEDPVGGQQNSVTSEERSRSAERRSYSMEHFRWGKPSGRKRRPVKVFSSSLEGEGSSEGTVPLRARRRLEVRRRSDTPPARSKASYSSYSKQERKDGTYRMSHFRWGSPPTTKRTGSPLKQWPDERPQNPLSRLLRNFMGKDMERVTG